MPEERQPLETMPGWAQEIVVDQGLGLLEQDAWWKWVRPDDCIEVIVHIDDDVPYWLGEIFIYELNKATGSMTNA